MPDDELVRALSEIQRRGAIGRTPLPAAIAHSDRFVAALPDGVSSLVDLGSGGGLPGLVIAHRRRDLIVTLIERRSKRVDLLRYGVRTLGLGDTVTVYDGDAAAYASTLTDDAMQADVVTARSFGPVRSVLLAAATILRPGGTTLVSDPPGGAPSVSSDLLAWGFEDLGATNGIHRFRRFHVEHPG